jgi:RNA polymerase sigma factor (sigma-70 family)
MEDKEIIELIRRGNHTRAFEKVYGGFPAVRKMIITSGGTVDDAKDIFQDSILVFYRMALKPDFILSSAISTFIYSVSRRLWLKKIRDEGPKKYAITGEDLLVGDSEDMEKEMEESQKIGLAEKVVNALGEPCRTLLLLFYFEKASMKEIAEQLGYSNEKTAKAQKYKCIERGKKMVAVNGIALKGQGNETRI